MSYWTKASGTSFRQKEIDKLSGEELLTLEADPTNEYDKYAVKVSADGVMVGWIPKGQNEQISKALQSGKAVQVSDYNITGGGETDSGEAMNYGLNLKITMPSESDLSKYKKIVPDIGEGHVYFDEENHRYFNEQGVQMISGSRLEEMEVGPTDMSYAAEAIAKTTKIPKQKILDIWSQNGDLSAAFGTVVHNSFEFYIKNKEEMMHYDFIKERPHTAMHWMPNTVGAIVDEYIREIYSLDNSRSEVFVRYGDYCGYIDHLVYLDEDVVELRDFKFINKIKKVRTKSYGSVTKYSVQASLYAEILKANGYTVKSITLDTYNGTEWEAVPIEKVNIDVRKDS